MTNAIEELEKKDIGVIKNIKDIRGMMRGLKGALQSVKVNVRSSEEGIQELVKKYINVIYARCSSINIILNEMDDIKGIKDIGHYISELKTYNQYLIKNINDIIEAEKPHRLFEIAVGQFEKLLVYAKKLYKELENFNHGL